MAESRHRDFCFTVNNYDEEDQAQCWALPWEAKHCRYIVVGKEVGENGTPHLQGFICFKETKSLDQLKGFFPTAHFEVRRGTYLQASEYCKNEGDYFEWGTLPMDPVSKGQKGREAFAALMKDTIKLIGEGNYEAIAPEMTTHIRACEYRIHKERQQKRNLCTYLGDLGDVNFWYYGAAGTGKSRKAREENPGAYLKMCNKWWEGYVDEDVVLIEDFDAQHKVLVHHLKIWADRYPFKAEIKGGSIDIRPRKIIVTSNYSPREIWDDPRDYEPIERRFKVVHFLPYFGTEQVVSYPTANAL